MAETKAKATKAAGDSDGVDPKIVKAAAAIRGQGGTAAIISHSLGVSYNEAKRLAAAYDKSHGNHPPAKIVRVAEGIKLDGFVVRDGRAPAPAKKKAAKPKAKTAAKAKA